MNNTRDRHLRVHCQRKIEREHIPRASNRTRANWSRTAAGVTVRSEHANARSHVNVLRTSHTRFSHSYQL